MPMGIPLQRGWPRFNWSVCRNCY